MVVEHAFVTTLPPAEAMRRASEFLAARGYTLSPTAGRAFAVAAPGGADAGRWTTLQVVRGKPTAAAARRIADLPQQVQLEWDRGRVTVAASIADRFSVKKRQQLLFATVTVLDALLARPADLPAAATAWATVDAQLHRRAFNVWGLLFLFLFVGILIVRVLPVFLRVLLR